MIDLQTELWETLPNMNDSRPFCKQVCFIEGHAYVAGGDHNEKAQKFDYSKKEWISLPNHPIKDTLASWSSALTFTPQKTQQEKKEDCL